MMTDYKPILHNLFETIKLLKPQTSHYALRQAGDASGPAADPFQQQVSGGPQASQERHENLQNDKRLLTISNEPLTDEEVQQIDKILLACKLDLKEKTMATADAILRDGFPVADLHHLFLFGTGPSELGFNFELPLNRMIRLNGSYWIKTLPVKALIKSQEAKSDLWKNGLQAHFQTR